MTMPASALAKPGNGPTDAPHPLEFSMSRPSSPKASGRAAEVEAISPSYGGDMLVVYRDPKTLARYGRNSRTHSPEQIAQIEASIREFGFTNPVLLKDDERTIGAGHARTLAAIALGLERIPTITLPGLTEAQWRAYVIADNKLALNAGWDESLLKLEFAELSALNFDLALTGFSLGEAQGFVLGPNDPNAKWQGMPEFEQANKKAFRSLVVHFKDARSFSLYPSKRGTFAQIDPRSGGVEFTGGGGVQPKAPKRSFQKP